MTWTFINDFTSQRDKVRMEIGDITNTDQLLSDEAIAYAGTVEGSDLAVAARCCEWIAAALGRKVDITEGHLSLKLSQRCASYQMKAQLLRARAATESDAFTGGISVSDKESTNDDTDRVAPAFFRNMTDDMFAQPLTPTGVTSSDEDE